MKQKRFFLQTLSLCFILFGLFAGVIIVSNKDAVLKRSSAASCAGLNKGCMTKACCPGLECDAKNQFTCACPSFCKNGCTKTDTGYECAEPCKKDADCPATAFCLSGICVKCRVQGTSCDDPPPDLCCRGSYCARGQCKLLPTPKSCVKKDGRCVAGSTVCCAGLKCRAEGDAKYCSPCKYQGTNCSNSAECCSGLKCLLEDGNWVCDAYVGSTSTPTPKPATPTSTPTPKPILTPTPTPCVSTWYYHCPI